MKLDQDASVDHEIDSTATLTTDATYRRLCFAGLTPRQAGTLTGRLAGLPMVSGGWAIGEVAGLLGSDLGAVTLALERLGDAAARARPTATADEPEAAAIGKRKERR